MAACVFLALTNAPLSSPHIVSIGEKLSSASTQQIVDAFYISCPILDNARIDIEEIKVDISPEFSDERLSHGWSQNVHLALKLANETQILPAFSEEFGIIQGHTLHYDIGSGRMPGIYGSKRVSQWACGIPIVDGYDSFRTDPTFLFIQY